MLLIPSLSTLLLCASSARIASLPSPVRKIEPPRVRYVFLFIGDGMGPAQTALAEAYRSSIAGDTLGFAPLSFTSFPELGTATTQCATRRTTESSAAATALATGNKAADGTIGLAPRTKDTLRTIAEDARDAGRKVGILTTVSVDHATPAGFYAHVSNRNDYATIASQAPASGFDVLAGGGFLDPAGVWQKFQAESYAVAQGRTALRNHRWGRVVALAPTGAPVNALPWELDRAAADTDQPTLSDFVRETARLLEGNPQGFFVMAEAGRIDWACHSNDAGSMIGEVLALDSAVRAALSFAERHPGEVLVVVTGDHETGGLSLGRTALGYQTNFGLYQYQKSSRDALIDSLQAPLDLFDSIRSTDSCLAVIARRTGLGREIALESADKQRLLDAWRTEQSYSVGSRGTHMGTLALAMLAEKAGIGWSSTAHTSLPLPVYAWGAGAEAFRGRMDNTDIAKRLRAAMGIGMKAVAKPTPPPVVAPKRNMKTMGSVFPIHLKRPKRVKLFR